MRARVLIGVVRCSPGVCRCAAPDARSVSFPCVFFVFVSLLALSLSLWFRFGFHIRVLVCLCVRIFFHAVSLRSIPSGRVVVVVCLSVVAVHRLATSLSTSTLSVCGIRSSYNLCSILVVFVSLPPSSLLLLVPLPIPPPLLSLSFAPAPFRGSQVPLLLLLDLRACAYPSSFLSYSFSFAFVVVWFCFAFALIWFPFVFLSCSFPGLFLSQSFSSSSACVCRLRRILPSLRQSGEHGDGTRGVRGAGARVRTKCPKCCQRLLRLSFALFILLVPHSFVVDHRFVFPRIRLYALFPIRWFRRDSAHLCSCLFAFAFSRLYAAFCICFVFCGLCSVGDWTRTRDRGLGAGLCESSSARGKGRRERGRGQDEGRTRGWKRRRKNVRICSALYAPPFISLTGFACRFADG